jgi:Flp pilus assembly protein TadB
MAQTKRRRQSKHRGNAAGVVESRGRTGRKPTAAEKSGDSRALAREKEMALDKRDRPPSWRGAFVKAMFAGIVLLLLVIVVFKQSNQAIGLFPVVIAFYTVVSYYMDKWMYDRRRRNRAKQTGGGRTAP